MNKATLIADQLDIVKAAQEKVSRIARAMMVELTPFTHAKSDDVLNGDTDRVVSLSLDLPIARSELAQAIQEYEALKRRAQ